MEHNCKYQDIIKEMHTDIRDIKKDVSSLLRFKWQLMGGAATLAFILSLAITCILPLFIGGK